MVRTLADRFWSKVNRRGADECWEWNASLTAGGYGQLMLRREFNRPVVASRISFFLEHGRWPAFALHRCDNRKCCNPAHIFEGSKQDNTDDMRNKGRMAKGPKQSAAVRRAWETRRRHANL